MFHEQRLRARSRTFAYNPCAARRRCRLLARSRESWQSGSQKGYIEDTEDDQERAGEAAKDLPNARAVVDLLDAYVDATAPSRQGNVIEDHFWIEKIEPGKLWLKPLTAGDFLELLQFFCTGWTGVVVT